MSIPPLSATFSQHSFSDASEAHSAHSWSTAAAASSSSYRLHESFDMGEEPNESDKGKEKVVTCQPDTLVAHDPRQSQEQGDDGFATLSSSSIVSPQDGFEHSAAAAPPKRRRRAKAPSKAQILGTPKARGTIARAKVCKREHFLDHEQPGRADTTTQLPPATLFSFLPPSSLLVGTGATELPMTKPTNRPAHKRTKSHAPSLQKHVVASSSDVASQEPRRPTAQIKEKTKKRGTMPRSVSYSSLESAMCISQGRTNENNQKDNDTIASQKEEETGQPANTPQEHISRPPNSFICFRRQFVQSTREAEAKSSPPVMRRQSQANVSRLASVAWKALSEVDRQKFINEAEEKARQHRLQYPDYKFTPTRRKSAPVPGCSPTQAKPTSKWQNATSSPSSSRPELSAASSPTSIRPDTSGEASQWASSVQRQMPKARRQRQRPQTLDLTLPMLSHEPMPNSNEWMSSTFQNTFNANGIMPSSMGLTGLLPSSSPETTLTMSASPQPATPSTSDAVMTSFARLFALTSPQQPCTSFAEQPAKALPMSCTRAISQASQSGAEATNGSLISFIPAAPVAQDVMNGSIPSALPTMSAEAQNCFKQTAQPSASATHTDANNVFSGFNDPWLLDVLVNESLLDTSLVGDDNTGPPTGHVAPTQNPEVKSRASTQMQHVPQHGAEIFANSSTSLFDEPARLPESNTPGTQESCCIDDFIIWPMSDDGNFIFADL